MPSPELAMVGSYDYRLVALSVAIAVLASYAALDVAERVTSARSGIRFVWLAGGAVAMGIGIWSMHYMGMLAFRLPVPVQYDWPTVLVSLLAAIFASAIALFVVSREKMGFVRAIIGSVFMGSAILHVTTSIGVSVYPDDGLDAETLLKNADTAMYQSKENGRQSFQFFKSSMNGRAVERQSIEEGLRRALERNEFTLQYQPKVNLKTNEITGAEAWLRWNPHGRGPVSPAKFIPVAEDCGLILPIGKWVLREACTQARAWVDARLPPIVVAVNISAMEFRHEQFLEGVFEILKETGMDPKLLELELTESVLMKRVEATGSILETLRAKGVRVAVDDFGTGYSSLSYLRKFPIDALKIDQSFVRQITKSPGETSIVTAIISMGQSLGLRVIAEGVETREELAFLQAQKCEEAQGYHFSRPLPPGQFVKLLETGIPEAIVALRTGGCI